ncbi:hypothetical protein C8R47DRAFT_1189885 [Mycena vitilis]|nr:hypothetical protein C8R47DRAFT_1189885 [Mycena vitilis]
MVTTGPMGVVYARRRDTRAIVHTRGARRPRRHMRSYAVGCTNVVSGSVYVYTPKRERGEVDGDGAPSKQKNSAAAPKGRESDTARTREHRYLLEADPARTRQRRGHGTGSADRKEVAKRDVRGESGSRNCRGSRYARATMAKRWRLREASQHRDEVEDAASQPLRARSAAIGARHPTRPSSSRDPSSSSPRTHTCTPQQRTRTGTEAAPHVSRQRLWARTWGREAIHVGCGGDGSAGNDDGTALAAEGWRRECMRQNVRAALVSLSSFFLANQGPLQLRFCRFHNSKSTSETVGGLGRFRMFVQVERQILRELQTRTRRHGGKREAENLREAARKQTQSPAITGPDRSPCWSAHPHYTLILFSVSTALHQASFFLRSLLHLKLALRANLRYLMVEAAEALKTQVGRSVTGRWARPENFPLYRDTWAQEQLGRRARCTPARNIVGKLSLSRSALAFSDVPNSVQSPKTFPLHRNTDVDKRESDVVHNECMRETGFDSRRPNSWTRYSFLSFGQRATPEAQIILLALRNSGARSSVPPQNALHKAHQRNERTAQLRADDSAPTPHEKFSLLFSLWANCEHVSDRGMVRVRCPNERKKNKDRASAQPGHPATHRPIGSFQYSPYQLRTPHSYAYVLILPLGHEWRVRRGERRLEPEQGKVCTTIVAIHTVRIFMAACFGKAEKPREPRDDTRMPDTTPPRQGVMRSRRQRTRAVANQAERDGEEVRDEEEVEMDYHRELWDEELRRSQARCRGSSCTGPGVRYARRAGTGDEEDAVRLRSTGTAVRVGSVHHSRERQHRKTAKTPPATAPRQPGEADDATADVEQMRDARGRGQLPPLPGLLSSPSLPSSPRRPRIRAGISRAHHRGERLQLRGLPVDGLLRRAGVAAESCQRRQQMRGHAYASPYRKCQRIGESSGKARSVDSETVGVGEDVRSAGRDIPQSFIEGDPCQTSWNNMTAEAQRGASEASMAQRLSRWSGRAMRVGVVRLHRRQKGGTRRGNGEERRRGGKRDAPHALMTQGVVHGGRRARRVSEEKVQMDAGLEDTRGDVRLQSDSATVDAGIGRDPYCRDGDGSSSSELCGARARRALRRRRTGMAIQRGRGDARRRRRSECEPECLMGIDKISPVVQSIAERNALDRCKILDTTIRPQTTLVDLHRLTRSQLNQTETEAWHRKACPAQVPPRQVILAFLE